MRIKLKYPDVETFIQKYAVNISRGGIFIATKQPKAVGTFVRFEFLLSDAGQSSIIRGEGQVQWTKEFDAAHPAKPHGMGVKFSRLDADSQALIDRALRWRADHGTSPGAPPPAPTSSAHTISSGDGSQADPLPPGDGGESERAGAAAPEPSRADRLPTREGSFAGRALEPPREELPEVRPMAAMPLDGRGETRPIAIVGDEDPAALRAPQDSTRPIELPRSRGARAKDDIDALANEWGLSDEKLARALKRTRPRMAEATAELERLLLKPPRSPAPTKAEALAQLGALLTKKNGRNGTPTRG